MVGLGGENIGTAYIRILADGSGLDRSIRDELDNQGVFDAFDENGRKTSDRWRKAFEEEQNKAPNQRELRDALAGPLARGDWLSQTFFRSKNWEDFRAGLKNEYGDAGERAGKNFEESLFKGMDFKTLKAHFENITHDLDVAEKQLDKERLTEHQKMLSEAYQMDKDYNSKRTRLLKEAYQMNKDFDSQTFDLASRMNRELDAQIKKSEQDRAKLIRDTLSEFKRFQTETGSLLRGEPGARDRGSLLSDFARLRDVISSNHLPLSHLDDDFKRNETRLREFTPRLHSLTVGAEKFGSTIGKFFGKGSRNNFLNFIGSFVGGLASLPSLLTKGVENLVAFGRKVQGVFTEADSVSKGLLSVLGSIATAGVAGAAGLVLLAVAAAALILIIGPLVSLLSLLLGALLALASSVIIGAIGGIAALAGALLPLVFGLGAVVIGFSAWDKTAKKNSQQLNSLKKDWYALGASIRSGLFSNLPQQLTLINNILKTMGPLLHAAGLGASNFFTAFLKGLQGSAFKDFERVFGAALPGMLRTWGQIAADAFTGLAGILRALIPLGREFLGWLAGITQQFSDWANSRSGQKDIATFLNNAATAARSLARFLGQAGGLLVDLISSGNKSGTAMFDELTKKVAQFRDSITTPIAVGPGMAGRPDPTGELPKNQTTNPVQQWFTDAKKFADALGSAAVSIAEIITQLDSPTSRQNLLTILNLVNDIASAINALPALGEALFPAGAIAFHLPQIAGIISAFASLGPKLRINLSNMFTGVQSAVANLLASFAGTGRKILHAIGPVNVSRIIIGTLNAVAGLLGAFAGIPGKILARISPVDVSGIISGVQVAVSKLLSAFAGMAKKILDLVGPVNVSNIITGLATAAGTLIGWAHSLATIIGNILSGIVVHINWPSPPGWLSKVTADGGIFAGAQARIIGEAGPEAVVPLNRPLNMVDPAVRWLSAIAQGKDLPMASGGVAGGGGRTVNVGGITVISPQADPRAVAVEAINHLVAVGY